MHSPIDSPADWRGPDLICSTEWIHQLTPIEVAEIDAALKFARARGSTLATLTREDFPLPTVAKLLARARDELEDGRGLYLIRGFPSESYGKDDLRLIYWGLGKHIGTAVSQSSQGDLLGDVRNFHIDLAAPQGRGYKTNQKLSFHCDSCDVVGLFVLRTAKSGGMSKICSALAVHNEIARTRPDLLEILYQHFFWSWQTQEPPGALPYYPQPVYSVCEGKFSSRLVRQHIMSAQRFPEVPRLTAQQIEALDLIDSLTAREDIHFSMMFQPGDLQLLNNHLMFHARTAFEDYGEHDRRRHLLRMWLSVPNSRRLSPVMGTIYRDQSPGAVRGGFPSRTGTHSYETVGNLD
jgi:hypothetical protein